MLKEAIEKIVSLAAPTMQTIEENTFCITPDGQVQEIHPKPVFPGTLSLTSLDALVKLVRSEAIGAGRTPLYITIPDHLTAKCFIQPIKELRGLRPTLYVANATDVPGWGDSTQLRFEEAMIALRTRFQDTSDVAYALKLLSDITTGAKITYSDNGVATSVVTQTGISIQSNVSIRPIVSLKPYRTFQEVAQPESEFLIRITERGILFTEADGGMWKLKAREIIKAHLEAELAAEVEDRTVIVAL